MQYLALDPIRTRSSWPWIAVRRVASLSRLPNVCSNMPLLALSAEAGLQRRPVDGGRQPASPETIAKYWVVHPSNLVFNPMWAIEGSVAVSDTIGAVSAAYRVYELHAELHPRFAHYYFRSDPVLTQYRLMIRGITTFDRSIKRHEFESMPIPIPPLDEQRAIANYLDVETARISALMSKKRRMIELLEERLQAQFDDWFQSLASAHGLVSIRRWSNAIEQGWSPVCDSEPAGFGESGVIKTSAVSSGRFVATNNKRLLPETECDTRWLLHDGDLLVTRGSGSRSMVGRACVAYVENQSLTLSDLVYRVRLTQADPEFVAAALLSSPARAQIESSIRTDVGQTLKIRRDDLADIRVPAAPFNCHVSEVAKLTDRLSPYHAAKLMIERQIELLAERKQALISALVSGEISVPDMSP